MKMTDLGETYPRLGHACASDCNCDDKEKKEKKRFPRESFTTEQLPSLAGKNVGDKVTLIIEAEVCQVSKGEDYFEDESEKVKTRVTLKMLSGTTKDSGSEPSTAMEAKDKASKDFNSYIGADDEDDEENDEE